VWLVTDRRNQTPIEAALASECLPGLHPVYLDLPRWTGSPWQTDNGLRNRYLVWQLQLRRAARRLHATVGFDVAHHLTLASDWLPCGLAALDDVPLVWGPVGGVAATPLGLWRWLGPGAVAAETARLVLTSTGRRLFGDRTARRAAVVVAQNRHVARRFAFASRTVVEPNIALALPPAADRRSLSDDRTVEVGHHGRLRAVFAGRLLAWKGLRLAVAALARPEAAGWLLDVYGEGEEEAPCRRLATDLGVAERVRFRGRVAREHLLATLAGADALLFPSLHDGAGWVVAEALAAGCPVVCLDLAGPGDLVTEATGVTVPPAGDVVGGLAAGLHSLAGRSRPVHQWSADRIPALLDQWYQWAIDAAAEQLKARPSRRYTAVASRKTAVR
jgi:glycosyltransferase involved in cell wall biosynthesis